MDLVCILFFPSFWSQLGSNLAANGDPKSTQNRSKSHPKSIHNLILFFMPSWTDFWSIFVQLGLQNHSKMHPRNLENRSRMPPGGLPGASREPELIFDAFLVSLEALLGAPGALLGSSWGLLGRSRNVPGGSFWPRGGHFSELFERSCWKLGLGHAKKTFLGCFSVLLYACLFLMLLSSLAFVAAPPTAKRSLKKHEKTMCFLDQIAWVPLLRQVQRKQLSEHRRTNSQTKNK